MNKSQSSTLCALLVALALGAFGRAAAAQEIPEEAARILSAVVGVVAEVPDSARTVRALGKQRSGSGVVIDAEGLVATIGYLILEATEVELVVEGARRVPARIVGYDADSGFGLLRATEPLGVTPITLGESASVTVNDPVVIASFTQRPLLSPAVVVSREAFAGYWEYLLEEPILTYPPHSSFGGAALLSPDGRLLGIGSLVLNDISWRDEQVPGNLFVPIDELSAKLGELLTLGRAAGASRPWLGVYVEEVAERVQVVRVAEEGPAEAAGLLRGDVIAGVGGEPVHSLAELYRHLWATGDAGVGVALSILRDGTPSEIMVLSADRYDWYRGWEKP